MRPERVTQNRVIQLLSEQLQYTYLGNLEEQENSNIREEDVKVWLQELGYLEAVIGRAIFDFKKTAALNPSDDLYPINREVYSKLRYGVKVKDEGQ